MTDHDINPFQVLYVTDSPDPRLFVELFSNLPIQFAQPVFQIGNVVLKGTQGSGKSMLLNLLKPEIRLAFAKSSVDFPIASDLRQFVGAGINLTLSGALDIGQRPLSGNPEDDEKVFPLYFADFLNYFIVRDLLCSIELMAKNPIEFDKLVSQTSLDRFAGSLAAQNCWFGSLSDCSTFKELCEAIDERIAVYRSFHQFNRDLPHEFHESKTNIGEPIACTEEILKQEGVIKRDTPIFVRIDQVERLLGSDVLRPRLGEQYRRIINKALSKRDSRVSYRIGTRPYAWDDDLHIYGRSDKLEHMRDFRIVDLDDKMRRKENRQTWLFPDFASDAFRRRLIHAGLQVENLNEPIEKVFGQTPNAQSSAAGYAINRAAEKVLKIEDDWPEDWKQFLSDLFQTDSFEATLAAAWARQRGQSGPAGLRLKQPPPRSKRPWNRSIWRKERARQCIMQIAARCSQRLKWSGKDAILSLSTPNISVFLSVCHEIWDAFLRSERRRPFSERIDPLRNGIHADIQSVGIHTASRDWYRKISEQPDGHDRQRFVDVLGRFFRSKLLRDDAMSYPGHNGFSLTMEEIGECPQLATFLHNAADYGDLYEAEHTTKQRNKKLRRKWYLSPILSAFFQIPEAHPKEPYYTKINEVIQWLQDAQIVVEGISGRVDDSSKSQKSTNQQKLLGFDLKGESVENE